jgi:hypothetical protein
MALKSSTVDPNHKEIYGAHCQLARSSGKLGKSQPKKIGMRQSLGPIKKYNFLWGSNLHSVDLSQKEL